MAYDPYSSDDDEDRERVIRFKKNKLTKSSEPDCLIGYDDDDNIDRAEIGCPNGHSMAAETMYQYIIQSIERNTKVISIPCPICSISLDWDQCTQIADMSPKEYADCTRVIEKRMEGETVPCPKCKAGCQKKSGLIIFRINCCACKGPDFCWNCSQQWKPSLGGLIVCGNDNCQLIKDANKCLAESALFCPPYLNNGVISYNLLAFGYIRNVSMELPKDIIDLINVFIPKIIIPRTRACPMCLTFMQQVDGCKHTTCIGCNGKFCFVCLAKYDKTANKWPCNEFTKDFRNNIQYDCECKPAPIQNFKEQPWRTY